MLYVCGDVYLPALSGLEKLITWMLVGQNDMKSRAACPHLLALAPAGESDGWSDYVQEYEGTETGSGHGMERDEEQFKMHTGRFSFTDLVDLDSYFREWLVYQSFWEICLDGDDEAQADNEVL